MTPEEHEEKRSFLVWLWRSRVGWLLCGVIATTLFWIWIYDPSVLGLGPTVVNPVKPPAPKPDEIVVEPLSRNWDLDSNKVQWDPVLPLAQISEAVYQEGAVLEAALKQLGLERADEFVKDSMYPSTPVRISGRVLNGQIIARVRM